MIGDGKCVNKKRKQNGKGKIFFEDSLNFLNSFPIFV